MPGARLTHDDRLRIAAWLAEGQGYAEVARRLGRPTSTISREVARNGGPGDYLADRAQRTAGLRAGRRKPPPATEPATDGRPAELVRDFVERFATLLAETGMPRMAARVFVSLLTADSGSLTSAELVHRLRVSPASVSKAVGYLETMELLVREPEPGRRRERYVIIDDVWLRAWRADTGAHARVATAAQSGSEFFGAGTPAGSRLDKMGQFFAWLSGQMGDTGFAETTMDDALTVLAALVHAARPLAVGDLAAALGWPRERAAEALETAGRRPAIADPLTLVTTEPDTYAVTSSRNRLSPAQRKALRGTSAG